MVFRKISDDVKIISLELQDRGFSLDDVADLLSVSTRSIKRWKANFDLYDSVQKPPQLPRGRPREIPFELLDALHILIQAEPSAYLEEMQNWLLYEHGIITSIPTIDRNLRSLGLTHKKLTTLAKERNDNKRFDWREWVNANFMAEQIVCTDESYKDARTHSRSYGRAIRGQDAFELTAFVRGQRFSMLPALTTNGIIAAHIVEGPVNGEIFIDFIVNQVLPRMNPYPEPNSVLLMDNCAIHYVFELEEILNAQGCVLLPLPAYSPDFNPIEKVFHQVKEGLRKEFMDKDEGDEALEAIIQQLGHVTPTQAMGYYRNCGFNTGGM